MSSTQIITHINSFARIVQRRQPAFVTSPKVADPAIKLQQKQIYNSLPKDSVKHLLPDLELHQLKNLQKMHHLGLKMPKHWFIPPKFTVPTRGAVPELSVALRKCGGRNHHGHITVRHRGGGFKRRIRLVDTRRITTSDWKVVRIEHDPNRSAKIALLQRENVAVDPIRGPDFCYVLAAEGMQEGQLVSNGARKLPTPGSNMPLADIAPGTHIHNVEMTPGRGGAMCRVAGSKALLVNKDATHATVRMPSGTQKRIPLACRASIGAVGNAEWGQRVIGTAGRNRRLGKRPTVRGVAMNAVDHPHGGGKGGRSKGNHSQSPWGWTCK